MVCCYKLSIYPSRTPDGLGVAWVPLAVGATVLLYVGDVWARDRLAATRAKELAGGGRILNVGSGTALSSATGAKLWGSVNCDLAAPKEIPCGPTTVCHCNVEDLSKFPDKSFKVALASNVMKYVTNKAKALSELHRVAENVIVSDNYFPWMQIGAGNRWPQN